VDIDTIHDLNFSREKPQQSAAFRFKRQLTQGGAFEALLALKPGG
jgi:hypothetical protein